MANRKVQKYVEDGIEVQSGKKKKAETTAVWASHAHLIINTVQ